MIFKTNEWIVNERGYTMTTVGTANIFLNGTTKEHFRDFIGLGEEKLPFFIDYVLSYLGWTPQTDIEIIYHSKPHMNDLGHYYKMDKPVVRHSISIRRPMSGWSGTKQNILMLNLYVVAHEMVHAWQEESGRLSHERSRYTIWEGEEWDTEKHPWQDRPWEQEAESISRMIMKTFIEMMENGKYDGN